MKLKQYDYSKYSQYYDIVELHGTNNEGFGTNAKFNKWLAKMLKQNKAKTVLDASSGTGLQSVYLAKKKFNITAADLSNRMLKIAKKKAEGLPITFRQGNMITKKYGTFDAIITINNVLAHLTPKNFEKTAQNFHSQLSNNGIYIFDIFNFDFIQKNFVSKEFIDQAFEQNGVKYVRLNKNKLNKRNKIIHLNQRTFIQKGISSPKVIHEKWDMQLYTSSGLQKTLKKSQFKTIKQYNTNGQKFSKTRDLSIVTVAKKQQ
jgi:2-polyprenyl-3-methyl-5-hydroxy-6-metoxy-1,4-benzoquinol methylase